MEGTTMPTSHSDDCCMVLTKELIDFCSNLDFSTTDTINLESTIHAFVKRFYDRLWQTKCKSSTDSTVPVAVEKQKSSIDPGDNVAESVLAASVLAAAHSLFSAKLTLAEGGVYGCESASFEDLVQNCPNVSELLGVSASSIALVVDVDKRMKRKPGRDHRLAADARSLKSISPVKYGELCEIVLREDPRLKELETGRLSAWDTSKSVLCELPYASSLSDSLKSETVLYEDPKLSTVACVP